MDVRETINEVLEQEIDRKQFLQRLGIAALAAFGISRLFKQRKQGAATRGTKGFGGTINLKDRR